MDWILVSEGLPKDLSKIQVACAYLGIVYYDCMFIKGEFITRERPNVGGIQGYKQESKTLKLEERLNGFSIKPTHWRYQSLCPSI